MHSNNSNIFIFYYFNYTRHTSSFFAFQPVRIQLGTLTTYAIISLFHHFICIIITSSLTLSSCHNAISMFLQLTLNAINDIRFNNAVKNLTKNDIVGCADAIYCQRQRRTLHLQIPLHCSLPIPIPMKK